MTQKGRHTEMRPSSLSLTNSRGVGPSREHEIEPGIKEALRKQINATNIKGLRPGHVIGMSQDREIREIAF